MESELDAIYSQDVFDYYENISAGTDYRGGPIDFRWRTETNEINNSSWKSAEIGSETDQIFAYAHTAPNVLDIVFVDQITLPTFSYYEVAGLSEGTGTGSGLILDSNYANSASGGELAAHEIGHLLGLEHTANNYNYFLMDPVLNGKTQLIDPELKTIFTLMSLLLQEDSNGWFIDVQPWLVVDSLDLNIAQTPLPAGVWLFGSALAGMGFMSRRKKKKAHLAA